MHCAIVLLSLCGIIAATPLENLDSSDRAKEIVPIIASENINDGFDGKFHYSFETGDGTKASQSGQLKTIDAEHAGEVVEGEFSYIGTDGQNYQIKYIADENGFQPQGAHLPTVPPVPEPIARALAYLATAPPPKEEQNSIKP